DQQLLILKERNTIARELHDSIAQSLSCLKIKLSILQMDLSNLDEEQISIIGEMREEVNVAYCQLRELLTTFRLRLDGLGFLPALENTVKEYNKKIGTKINFSYEIPANK
ncbi:histidine kinase, partial [Vibrio parahaemolyticus]